MTSTNDNNTSKQYGIEKFEGTFDKEELGVTIIPNKSINDIKNIQALGLYVFLLARPSGWKLNIRHLKEHFGIGRDKIRELLDYLLNEKYISCTLKREKGRFSKPHYRVHLHSLKNQETVAELDVSPEPENPSPVIPAPVDQYTYKTKNIENKEYKKTPIVPKGDEVGFESFWKLYPTKKGKKQCEDKWRRLKLDDQAEQIVAALQNQIANDDQWKRGFIPNPITYINGARWNDEISQPRSGKQQKKINPTL